MTVSKKRVGIILLGIILVISLVFGALAFRPNSASAAESDFYMVKGASIRVDEVTGIRFMARLKASAYDESATYGMLICPSSYLSGIEIDDETDYLAELSAKYDSGDIAHMPVDMECLPTLDEKDPNYYIVRGTIAKVKYNNLNREFTGIAYKRTGEEGSYLYEYADVDPSETSYSSRSISYVATASWNAGDFSENEDKLNTLMSIVFKSVAQKAGDTEETADGILSDGATEEYIADNVDGEMSATAGTIPEAVYSTGNAIELTTAVTVSDKAYNANVKYVSDNTSAVSVTDNVITIVGAGTATISAKVGDKVVDSKTIAVKILSLNSANYMAVGGDNAVSLSETAPVTYSSSDASVLTVAADGTVTALKDGSATITASINGGEVELEHDVRVIDFGYTTGAVKNFATEENLDLWSYCDGSKDGNATLTYQENVYGDNNGYSYNAIKYVRPSNTGAYRTIGNLMYLSSEVVSMAKGLGYRYVFMSVLVPTTAASSNRYYECYLTQADGQAYYGKTPANNSNHHAKYFTATSTNWNGKIIDLAGDERADNTGIGFHAYNRELYISTVRFVGADISDVVGSYLSDNITTVSSRNYYDNMLASDVAGRFLTVTNSSMGIEYSATGGPSDRPMITVSRPKVNDVFNNNPGQTAVINSAYVSSEWIMAVKAIYPSVKTISVKCKTDKGYYGFAWYKHDGTLKGIARNAADSWVELRFDIENFAQGDSFHICLGNATSISIADIRFIEGNKANLNWPS